MYEPTDTDRIASRWQQLGQVCAALATVLVFMLAGLALAEVWR